MTDDLAQQRYKDFVSSINDDKEYPLPNHRIDADAGECSCGAEVNPQNLKHFYVLFDMQQDMADSRAARKRAIRRKAREEAE